MQKLELEKIPEDEQIDIHDVNKIFKYSQNLVNLSIEYLNAKEGAADSKYIFDLSLSAQIEDLRVKKSNIGIDTALIMYLSYAPEDIRGHYDNYVHLRARAEGLEKVMAALQTQITLFQTVSKTLPK